MTDSRTIVIIDNLVVVVMGTIKTRHSDLRHNYYCSIDFCTTPDKLDLM